MCWNLPRFFDSSLLDDLSSEGELVQALGAKEANLLEELLREASPLSPIPSPPLASPSHACSFFSHSLHSFLGCLFTLTAECGL